MVFLKTPDTGVLDATGARVVVSRERLALPDAIETQVDGVWLYERTHSQGRAQVVLEDGRTVPPTWIADEPNRVVLKADVPGGGWLRLADQRWPGWKCTVDGHPTPIERADDVFRRVAVTKGARIVEFRYEPATTRVGHYLMLAAMAFLASLAGMALAGRRR